MTDAHRKIHLDTIIRVALDLPLSPAEWLETPALYGSLFQNVPIPRDDKGTFISATDIPAIAMFALLDRYPEILPAAQSALKKGKRGPSLLNEVKDAMKKASPGLPDRLDVKPISAHLINALGDGCYGKIQEELLWIKAGRERDSHGIALPGDNIFKIYRAERLSSTHLLRQKRILNLTGNEAKSLHEKFPDRETNEIVNSIFALAKNERIEGLSPDWFIPLKIQKGDEPKLQLSIFCDKEQCHKIKWMLEEIPDMQRFMEVQQSDAPGPTSLCIDTSGMADNFFVATYLADVCGKKLGLGAAAER